MSEPTPRVFEYTFKRVKVSAEGVPIRDAQRTTFVVRATKEAEARLAALEASEQASAPIYHRRWRFDLLTVSEVDDDD